MEIPIPSAHAYINTISQLTLSLHVCPAITVVLIVTALSALTAFSALKMPKGSSIPQRANAHVLMAIMTMAHPFRLARFVIPGA